MHLKEPFFREDNHLLRCIHEYTNRNYFGDYIRTFIVKKVDRKHIDCLKVGVLPSTPEAVLQ